MPDKQDTPSEPELQVPIVWVGGEDIATHTANQFLGQFSGPEEFIVTFGHIAPPPLLGTPEERLEQARQLSYVPVRAITRIGLTRQRVEELIGVLQQTLSNFDASQQKG